MLDKSIQQQVELGISVLRQGGLVAFPTDTVYGLGASVNIPKAVERVFRVKERPLNMALPLLPGALTIVLYKSNSGPCIVTAGGRTVAVRIPAHPVPVALARGLEAPIVGTSANLSGKPSVLTADEVYSQFGDKIDLIIDGGRCPGGKESTVIDVTGEVPAVVREGAISGEELREVCGNIIFKRKG